MQLLGELAVCESDPSQAQTERRYRKQIKEFLAVAVQDKYVGNNDFDLSSLLPIVFHFANAELTPDDLDWVQRKLASEVSSKIEHSKNSSMRNHRKDLLIVGNRTRSVIAPLAEGTTLSRPVVPSDSADAGSALVEKHKTFAALPHQELVWMVIDF